MRKKVLGIYLGMILTIPVWAINCFFTLAKDSCWTGYNVVVDVIDARTNQILTTVTVPAEKSWTRQSFVCEPSQKLMYHARFTPVFWQSDEGKTYLAKRFWSLPSIINQGDSAWNLSVCFASDFALVPFPPNATGNCACDFKDIPKLEPAIIMR
ncbi:MAG: hypothetical protein Q8M40_10010 [Legionella sp.]|nr:hypothetical protein [Legionella sp.]